MIISIINVEILETLPLKIKIKTKMPANTAFIQQHTDCYCQSRMTRTGTKTYKIWDRKIKTVIITEKNTEKNRRQIITINKI